MKNPVISRESSITEIFSKEYDYIKVFFSKAKSLIIFTYVLTFVAYGAKIVYYNYAADTEEFMAMAPDNHYPAWAQMGRYGLWLFKRLFSGYNINVFFVNCLTYILWGLTSILFCYLIYRMYEPKKFSSLYVIPALLIPSTIMMEQLVFILQSVEINLSYITLIISVLLVFFFQTYKKWSMYLVSVILTIVAFSFYQSNYITYVSLAIMSVLLFIIKSKKNVSLKSYIMYALPYLISFIVSFVINNVLWKIFLKLKNMQKIDYITGSITWGRVNTKDILTTIYNNIHNILFPNGNIFFSGAFSISFICVLVCILFCKKQKNKSLIIFNMILLLLTSFSMIFILGWLGPVRSMAPYVPMIIAFTFYCVFLFISNKYLRGVLFLVVSYFCLIQSYQTSNLAVASQIAYEEDVKLTSQIVHSSEALISRPLNTYKIVCIGNRYNIRKDLIRGEIIGDSFYHWNINSPIGSNARIANFMIDQGYPVQRPSGEEYQQGIELSKKMPLYPNKDGIKIYNDLIIVKLSE